MCKKSPREQRGDAQVKLPQRHQVKMHVMCLDEMIRDDHLARTVVGYVDSLDLSAFYDSIKSRPGAAGRSAIDPRILFSLWLFATLEGENSGRRVAMLCERDLAYMWICGDVSVNYHTICSFRSQHGALLDQILTDSITLLHHHGLLKLETIAQDGMRVRANAGSSSFVKQDTLEESRSKAKEYLEQVNQSDDDDDLTKGQQAARQRAAGERVDQLEAACLEMEQMQARYKKRNAGVSKKNKRSEPRASTTDPEARRMKMPDTGFRPALNTQFANDVDSLVIVSVDVTSEGSDAGLLAPMYRDVCNRYGTIPRKYLADGGFSKKAGVTELEQSGTKFFGPLVNEKKQLTAGKDPYAPRKRENRWYTAFRKRMGTEEAKEIYALRGAAAEFPNAICRNQNLRQFSVRGKIRAKAQALWHALAYNFRRFSNLKVEISSQSYLEVLMTS